MSSAQSTTDHEIIRRWAESRQGHPAVVKATKGKQRGSAGLLRIDFDPPEDSLEEVSWDEFFETFDEHGLTFLYQEKTDSGDESRFFKFVSESSKPAKASKKSSTRTKSATRKPRQASPQEQEEIEEEEEEELDEERGEDEEE